ncbi:TonB-dependent receptor [Rheinheimera sp. MMS21-TC3]|uniref:TonB-dependent receptor plug domain-containing protein n=1 Tax=Rheinheimera sp. MMS21-TC3 TaxID=3072790 RepID=UPI0028C3EFC5|nr:TonB-dependent receptor [Rheinheimera sp. MMS21-TC3]WNO60211.1 TonB-dependent receptor [Rheinheimera sp. MMS21-TC3]
MRSKKNIPAFVLAPISVFLSTVLFAQESQQLEKVERIAVTGSHIKRIHNEDATPVLQVTAEEIAVSGKVTLTEVLRDLTINTGNSHNEQATNSFSAGSASIGLRGLSPKNTLVLVNGQRISNNGFAQNTQDTFVDLNALPLSAVERIEVLKDGASSVYGSDAIAGVVNIILRRGYQGTEVKLSAGDATEGGLKQVGAGLVTGIGDIYRDGYNITASVDYFHRERLDANERKLTRSGDFRHLPGGKLSGWSSQGGNYLAAANNPQAFENCPTGSELRAGSDFNAGYSNDVCAFNTQEYTTLQPEITRRQFSLLGTYQLTEKLQSRAEFLYSYNDASQIFGTPLTVGAGLRAYDQTSGGLVDIPVRFPVGHPNNPTAEALPFEVTLFELGPRLKDSNQIFKRVIGSFNYEGDNWDWNFTALNSSSKQREEVDNFVNRYVFERVLADGSYDFVNGNNPQSLVDELRIQTLRPGSYEISAANFTASTILANLSSGELAVAGGVDFRHEKMNAGTSEQVLSGTELRPAINLVDGKRAVWAAFAELSVPIIDNLTADLAGRYDHYDDFGSAFSPKLGVHYVFNDEWLLRGSWSRGFRAPSLPEIANSNTVSYASANDPDDPVNAGRRVGFTQFRAGNPDLQAERSKNINAGIIWSPSRRLSLGFDVYRIEQDKIIASDNVQFILDNPQLYGDRIIRDAEGRLQIITNQFRNQGVRSTSGFDLDYSYNIELGDGHQIHFNSILSHLLSYKQALVVGQHKVDGAGNNQFGVLPEWKNNTSISWRYNDWQTVVSGAFTSGYKQKIANQTSNPGLNSKIASNFRVNSQLSYAGFANTRIALSVNNLLDRDPPFDPNAGATYANISQYNVIGRTISLSVSYQL